MAAAIAEKKASPAAPMAIRIGPGFGLFLATWTVGPDG